MAQIQEAFREFVQSGEDPSGPEERSLDRDTIALLHDSSQPMSDRVNALRKWWGRYRVARTLQEGEHERVARSFLEYFDDQKRDHPHLEHEFKMLTDIAKEHRRSDLRERRLTSLISKTLWLFYPESTPMYDKNAVTALRVLSRLYGLHVERTAEPYSEFLQVWQRAYSQIAPLIPDDRSIPYKVRKFDAFLWWLGQGNFRELDS